MAITKVNQAAGAASAATASQAISIPWTPVVGNLLEIWVGVNCANQTARTLSMDKGFTLARSLQKNASLTNSAMGAYFYKFADGTEGASPPTLSIAGATAQPSWVVTELPARANGDLDKINSSIAPTLPAAFLGYTRGTAGSDAGPALTMPNGDVLMRSALMGRALSGLTVTSWASTIAGVAADYNTSSGQAGMCLTATQEVLNQSGASNTHSPTYTNTVGNPAEIIGSVAWVVGRTLVPPPLRALQAVQRAASW